MIRPVLGYFLTAMISFIVPCLLVAQDSPQDILDRGWGIPEKPFNCEMNAANVEWLAEAFQKTASGKDVIIIIARRGKGERSSTLNKRRLHNALQYLLDASKIPKERIILAE